MELVYLWVKGYKNIHNQEFNFSPKFNCHYNIDTNDLTIDENDDYIENFFGDNINVTAIVGKNGSGKSSVIEVFKKINHYHHQEKNYKFIICLEVNNKINVISSIKNINCSHTIEHIEKEKYLEYGDKIENDVGILNCYLYDLVSEDGYIKDTKRISNLAIKNSKKDFTFELTTFMCYPKIILLYDNDKYKDLLINDIQPPPAVYSNNPENGAEFPPCYHDLRNLNTNNSLEAYMIKTIVEDDLCDNFFQEYNSPDDEEVIQKYYEKCSDYNKYSLVEYEELISNINYEVDKISKKNKELISKYNRFIIYDYKDNKGRKFSDLSHGEKSIYAQFILMYDVMKTKNDILFLVDEPDLSLHPEWQRKYLNEFMSTFSNMEKNIHLILTTHSPFLISDIPKQNIIFLDKDKDSKCKVVDGIKETFGQNIHTLLSDSFFMADGLMGEFAKKKIENVINFLQEQTSKIRSYKDAENIISIIGEPILKMRLEKMLDDYKIKQGIETEKDIQRKIDKLNQKLRKIKNGQDKPK